MDNWLRTPYIARVDSNRLWIEIRFTMRKCNEYPDPQKLQQCKESFKLLYYEAESDFANAMMPTWDTATYRHVDVIAADQTFDNLNDPGSKHRNKERGDLKTRSIFRIPRPRSMYRHVVAADILHHVPYCDVELCGFSQHNGWRRPRVDSTNRGAVREPCRH